MISSTGRAVGVLVLVLAASSFAAACGGGDTAAGSGPSGDATGEDVAETPESWLQDAFVPHSRLEVVGETLLYAGVDDSEGLNLVALDAFSGEVRWHEPIEVLDRPVGVEYGLSVYAARVYAFADSESGPVVEAVDVASGEVVWSSRVGPGSQAVAVCGAGLVCVQGSEGGLAQFDADDGTLVEQQSVDATVEDPGSIIWLASSGTEDESGLVFNLVSGELSQVASEGSVEWSIQLAEVFTGQPANPLRGHLASRTTDGGWMVWVASQVDDAVFESTPIGGSVPLGSVAGLSGSGQVRWLLDGWHPCLVSLAETLLFCDGELRRVGENESESTPETVGRIDEGSGELIWEFDLGGAVDEADLGTDVVGLGGSRLIISLGGDHVELDTESGAQRVGDEAEVGWCEGPLIDDSIKAGDGVTRDYLRTVQAFPCSVAGQADLPATRVPEWAGVNVDDLAIWVEGDAVRAEQR